VTRSTHELSLEVPLPEPQKPEREPERRPTHELRGLALDEASVWVAGLRQRLREFSRRNAGASLHVAVISSDCERVPVTDVQAGPGAGYVTLSMARQDQQLIIRLDQILRIELAVADETAEDRFRGSGSDFGFVAR
jgi:hypothetical protein